VSLGLAFGFLLIMGKSSSLRDWSKFGSGGLRALVWGFISATERIFKSSGVLLLAERGF